MGFNFVEQFAAGRSEDHAEGAAVIGIIGTADEVAGFETVHEAGNIGAVHDETAAEFNLSKAGRVVLEEVEDIELAGTEVPAGEEDAAGVPEVFGGAQEFDERLVTRAGSGGQLTFHE